MENSFNNAYLQKGVTEEFKQLQNSESYQPGVQDNGESSEKAHK